MNRFKITVFADPVCTWCWGSVAVIRALEYRYGEQLEVSYVMGGMIEDIRTFNNRRLGIGGDIEQSNRNMMKAWLDASQQHGMPVKEHGFHLFTEERRSTVPQNLAYIAAVLCSPKRSDGTVELDKAKRYMRRVQQATAAEAMHTNDVQVLVDLSAVEGFEPNRFREIMAGREARRIYDDGKALAAHYDVDSFPTYLMNYGGEELLLSGFQTCDTLEDAIRRLSHGKTVLHAAYESGRERLTPTRENVRAFVQRYGTVFPVEIATALGLKRKSGKSALNIESYEKLPDIVESLLNTEEVDITPFANSFKIFNVRKMTDSMRREREYAGTF